MARTYSYEEAWDISEGTDPWVVIRAVDSYLRVRVGVNERSNASIFDERGTISEPDLDAAYAEWEREPHQVRSVMCSYRLSIDELSAEVIVSLMHRPLLLDKHLLPNIAVKISGTDAATVRGIAAEAREKGQSGTMTPTPIASPPASLAPAEPIAMPAVDEIKALVTARESAQPAAVPPAAGIGQPPRPSRIKTFLNNKWVEGVGVTVIGGLILAYLFH